MTAAEAYRVVAARARAACAQAAKRLYREAVERAKAAYGVTLGRNAANVERRAALAAADRESAEAWKAAMEMLGEEEKR